MTDVTQDDVPEHITPAALYKMTGDEVDALVERLRTRRLDSVRQFEASQKAAQEAADEKARLQLMKQCEMCANNLNRVDKALDALETRVTKIRALRLELGLD